MSIYKLSAEQIAEKMKANMQALVNVVLGTATEAEVEAYKAEQQKFHDYVICQAIANDTYIFVLLDEDKKTVVMTSNTWYTQINIYKAILKMEPGKTYYVSTKPKVDSEGNLEFDFAGELSRQKPRVDKETGSLSLWDFNYLPYTPVEHITFTATLTDKYKDLL